MENLLLSINLVLKFPKENFAFNNKYFTDYSSQYLANLWKCFHRKYFLFRQIFYHQLYLRVFIEFRKLILWKIFPTDYYLEILKKYFLLSFAINIPSLGSTTSYKILAFKINCLSSIYRINESIDKYFITHNLFLTEFAQFYKKYF